MGETLWLGTYPPEGPAGEAGRGEGIWRLDLDRVTGALTGALAAPTPAPSFLALSGDGRTLYAAGETASGSLTRFTVAGGELVEHERVASGGADPCHLLVHPDGRALYVTNYSSGSVGVLTLDADGSFSAEVRAAGGPVQVLGNAGSGPVADRQEGPHAHSTLLAPGGQLLLSADLGTDELRRFRVLDDGRLAEAGVATTFTAGTGPRHLAVGPGDHLYAVGELSATLHVLRWDAAGTATELDSQPVCHSPVVSGDAVLPAHLVVRDGHVLVSVRGPDVLAQFAVLDGGARLEHMRDVPVGGAWPRHMAVVGDADRSWVVSAAQDSGRVTVLAWDASGVRDGLVAALDVPHPACVVAATGR